MLEWFIFRANVYSKSPAISFILELRFRKGKWKALCVSVCDCNLREPTEIALELRHSIIL